MPLSKYASVTIVHLLYFVLNPLLFSLCNGQTASCVSGNGTVVDWFIIYKAPHSLNINYLNSQSKPLWEIVRSTIEQVDNQPISNTLGAIFTNPIGNTIGGVLYNNKPPTLSGIRTNSTSKGVVLFNELSNIDAALWFVHTVPGFPKPMKEYAWPNQETPNGHMFLCLSMKRSSVNLVATQLIYQEPVIYWSQMSATYAEEIPAMYKLLNFEDKVYETPFVDIVQFSTTATHSIAHVTAFSKTSKARIDMFNKGVAPRLKSNINVWAKTDGTKSTTCAGHMGQVKVIKGPITINADVVKRKDDYAGWLVGETSQMWCFTTSAYTENDLGQAGATICLETSGLHAVFEGVAQNTVPCPYTLSEFVNLKSPYGNVQPGYDRFGNGLLGNNQLGRYPPPDTLNRPPLGPAHPVIRRPIYQPPIIYNSFTTPPVTQKGSAFTMGKPGEYGYMQQGIGNNYMQGQGYYGSNQYGQGYANNQYGQGYANNQYSQSYSNQNSGRYGG